MRPDKCWLTQGAGDEAPGSRSPGAVSSPGRPVTPQRPRCDLRHLLADHRAYLAAGPPLNTAHRVGFTADQLVMSHPSQELPVMCRVADDGCGRQQEDRGRPQPEEAGSCHSPQSTRQRRAPPLRLPSAPQPSPAQRQQQQTRANVGPVWQPAAAPGPVPPAELFSGLSFMLTCFDQPADRHRVAQDITLHGGLVASSIPQPRVCHGCMCKH